MAASKKAEAAPERSTVRLSVRTAPAHGGQPRYRASLGPFGREPLTVEATPEQAESLRADPMLIVE